MSYNVTGHRGSVLCLKFDRDWDILYDDEVERVDERAPRKGFMVSGSSNCMHIAHRLRAASAFLGLPQMEVDMSHRSPSGESRG
ncbi:hypothetical protein BD310DRAFT_442722 [Dichomitus squalens]|uniref:Uncharacterized protein n=1 Tax=Dichomitus squalens TaxID=114155 RepID=A0A4Q9PDH7_9APHY|nr:hypothetical protein BD310DRAFT_442722 [Dichomitus squalens]